MTLCDAGRSGGGALRREDTLILLFPPLPTNVPGEGARSAAAAATTCLKRLFGLRFTGGAGARVELANCTLGTEEFI